MYLRNISIKNKHGANKKGAKNIKTKNYPFDQNSYQWFLDVQ